MYYTILSRKKRKYKYDKLNTDSIFIFFIASQSVLVIEGNIKYILLTRSKISFDFYKKNEISVINLSNNNEHMSMFIIIGDQAIELYHLNEQLRLD